MSDDHKEAPMNDEGYRAQKPEGTGNHETTSIVTEDNKRQPMTHPMEVRRHAADLLC